MQDNLDTPNGFERTMDRIPEGAVLKWLFRGLLVATIGVLGLDYKTLMDAVPPEWPGASRTQPLTMEPAKPSDHVRPYLPRTSPVRRGGGTVRLPGFEDGVDPKLMNQKMIFRLTEKGAASAVGRIEQGTADDFERFVLANEARIKSLAIHSPGGSVSDALAIAKLIRKTKIDTSVPDNGYCASSCPLAYSGGVKRLAGKRSWIGVHQVYTVPSAIGNIHDGLEEAQRISAVSQQHLVDMGVDPQVWIHAMRTPKDKLYIFTPEQLDEYKLATTVTGLKKKKRKKKT
ncbi:MAG: ATP-dependent Clp protease proteolytic subunit [Hyphomicrobiaceae bacterium]